MSRLAKLLSEVRPLVGSCSTAANSMRILIDPATEQAIATVHESTESDVNSAVNTAREALTGDWGHKNGVERRSILLDIAHLIERRAEDFAFIESLNCGKPLREAREDVRASIECFRHFAGHADKLSGRIFCVDARYKSYTLREPLGVCGLITSYNYPLLLASWKMAPSLACGNAVVLKPAPQTPLSSILLGNVIADLPSMPPGVVNVVPGGEAVGRMIASHERIDKVSFTGSVEAGQSVLASTASNLKRVTLELGGKNPMIVFADANLDEAVEDVVGAIFSNAGQNCCAGSRLFLEASVHDVILDKLKARVERLRMSDSPLDEDSEFGALIDQVQLDKVMMFIEDSRQSNSGTLLAGGKRAARKGFFVEPTVFYDLPDSARVAREEVFGPVLSVLRPFATAEEAIRRANDSPYGLAAGVWTRDFSKAEFAVRNLRAGTTWVNCYNFTFPHLPFGGAGLSGNGGKDLGEEALDQFSFLKAVVHRLS